LQERLSKKEATQYIHLRDHLHL